MLNTNYANQSLLRRCPTLFALVFLLFASCEREIDELQPATFPTNGDVFIDAFSGGLEYAAFGGSDVTAFDTDTDTKYSGTTSMRFEVPDFEDPDGAYAGGAFFTGSGRDLTGYNVLTFWARASQPANIDLLGFGNDLGEGKYQASISDVPVNTRWEKYYIPIPDPSKLTQERGLFFYSEGPENNRGYTFWIDELQFEQLGTITEAEPLIFDGEDRVVNAEAGARFTITGSAIFNLPTGVDQRVTAAPAYFDYSSSNPNVATVNENGVVSVRDTGTAVITATLDDVLAEGSLTVTSTGMGAFPQSAAPTPDIASEDVISIFSNAYDDVPVDFYNGYWEFSTTLSFDVEVEGNDIIRYSMLNFVGIQFTAPTQDISDMTNLRMDIWTPDATAAPAEFKILLVDIGPDGSFGGNDDSSHEVTITAPTLQTEQWVTLDIPLSQFTGLTGRANLAQIVLSGDLPNVFMDNLFFYNDPNGGGGGGGGSDAPTVAAPAPPQRDGADVISVFSDAYPNAGANLNPDWGQSTAVSEVSIAGNNTLLYKGLNYQGTQFDESQDITAMETFHLDFWSANATTLSVFLISTGPVEKAVSLTVPTNGWSSIDIPLADFMPVDLGDVIQIKFEGDGDVYLDNLYFYREGSGGGGGGNAPTSAAPTPTRSAANVISLFSDAYDDVSVDTWRTEWSSATLEDISVGGNAVKKYSSLDFVGIETVANQIDISGMTHLHVDVWSPDFTLFGIKLVDFGPDGGFDGGDDTEQQVDFMMPAQGQWISYDIPLSDFPNLMSRKNLAQYILVAQPTANATVYIDNFYFYRE